MIHSKFQGHTDLQSPREVPGRRVGHLEYSVAGIFLSMPFKHIAVHMPRGFQLNSSAFVAMPVKNTKSVRAYLVKKPATERRCKAP